MSAESPGDLELIDRPTFAQANEAARCAEEGVLRATGDGRIDLVVGGGFAPFHGGDPGEAGGEWGRFEGPSIGQSVGAGGGTA